ncbi:MAG: hypothetical protein IT292_07920 [Deltaproteobacteria bacterium]|nr:hypothetical protein [Deltaproteobacteria bacterium]
MHKALVGIGVFWLGFALSIPVYFLTNQNSSLRAVKVNLADAKEFTKSASTAVSLTTPEERLALYHEALKAGSAESLQILNIETVSKDKVYQDNIAVLKQLALDTMVKKFTANDWNSWASSLAIGGGNMSEAARYVENIRTVNQPLGIFLDTAAFLLSGAKTTISQGKDFDAGRYLATIVSQFELSHHLYPELSLAEVYNLGILNDYVFLKILEQEKCRLTEEFIQNVPSKPKSALKLVRSLSPQYCGPYLPKKVLEMIVRVAKEASPSLRLKIASDHALMDNFEMMAATNTELRKAMAQFYVIVGIDALNATDTVHARLYHQASVRLAENISGQGMLMMAIERLEKQLDVTSPEDQLLSLGTLGFMLLIGLSLGGLIVYLVFYRFGDDDEVLDRYFREHSKKRKVANLGLLPDAVNDGARDEIEPKISNFHN